MVPAAAVMSSMVVATYPPSRKTRGGAGEAIPGQLAVHLTYPTRRLFGLGSAVATMVPPSARRRA